MRAHALTPAALLSLALVLPYTCWLGAVARAEAPTAPAPMAAPGTPTAAPGAPSTAPSTTPPVRAPEPDSVAVGIYVNQIYGIDLKASQFSADFWIWFRWAGAAPSPIDTFEIVGGRITSRSGLIKKKLPGGSSYAALRVNATIFKQWGLRHFPFDDHSVLIQIEDAERDASQAVFVADAANESVDPSVTVSGWAVGGHSHELLDHVYRSNYGDNSLSSGNESHYSRYAFQVELKREGVGRFFKFFFGLFVATLASWCAFFIRPKDASPRVSVSVGALFAAAAVTIAINNQLPDVGYLTLADKMVFLTLGMIFVSLLGTVSSLSLHYMNRESTHRRLDKIGAITFPLVYAVLLVWIIS